MPITPFNYCTHLMDTSRRANETSKPIWQTQKTFISLGGLIMSVFSIGLLRLHLNIDLAKYLIAFAAGAAFTTAMKHAWSRLLKSESHPGPVVQGEHSKIYGLKHAVLNMDVSETQMWMNMGYWKDQLSPKDFPHACRSLLQEVLFVAGLRTTSSVNILDIGFGYGNQAIALEKLCDIGTYIGLTIDQKQFAFAKQRLTRCGFLSDAYGMPTQEHGSNKPVRQIFHADAAKPDTWAEDLKNAESYTFSKANQLQKNWVLALDVLYHLTPSRLSLFRHACRDLNASIMAFDLLLPDPQQVYLTKLQVCVLKLVSLLTSTPYSNFRTPAQYRANLISAGYPEDGIEIRDISEHVFRPLVEYMTWQDRQLKTFGLGIGPFHAAEWVFAWWAQTGVVRGCIVVARAKDGDGWS